MQVIFLLVAFIAGISVAYAYHLSRFTGKVKESEARYTDADKQCGILNDRLSQTMQQMKSVEDLLTSERKLVLELNASLAGQKSLSDNLREKLDSQKEELELIQRKFSTEFENLSSKILEEKSKKFTEQNRANLDIILNPLKEKIKEFEQKVEQSYKVESAERNTLKGEIKNLIELNKQISEEATNLTRALKGDTKKQGNWGEIILERVLERSGLCKGSEFDLQFSTSNEDGRRIQPDVIVYLPEKKHIIIDAKVSLVAYELMVNATTDELRDKYLQEHLSSVRSHIKHLSEKNYFTSQELDTPDFVLIFMPIESSFGIAIQADNELFNYAWDRKIVLVSPTTLLATLKTISAIWKQEKQTRNALEIARVGGALYDKFVGFLKDMTAIGDKIRAAHTAHDEAMGKLSGKQGNVLTQVEKLKKLGAKANKEIPTELLERAEENDGRNLF